MESWTIGPAMSARQQERYNARDIERVAKDEFFELWGNDAIDPDEVELAVYRCSNGGHDCNCDEGSCDCCSNATLWENPCNVDGWKVECGECNQEASLVEFVGAWSEIKEEPWRFPGEDDAASLLRKLALYPAIRDDYLDALASGFKHISRYGCTPHTDEG